MSLKNPYNADIYTPILWKTYVNNNFITKGIPFLKSRRYIYYHFGCDEGAMKYLNKLRVGMDLTELDNKIREVVKKWSQKMYNKTKNGEIK